MTLKFLTGMLPQTNKQLSQNALSDLATEFCARHLLLILYRQNVYMDYTQSVLYIIYNYNLPVTFNQYLILG